LANGNGYKTWIVGIVAAVIATGFIASVGYTVVNAGEQGAMKVQVEANKVSSTANTEAVKAIPLMAKDIEYLRGDFKTMQDTIKINHKEVLDAINAK
jgi:hypothetical protein